MPRGRPRKDPFENLDPNFKATIDNGTEEEIRKKISENALYRAAQEEMLKNDPDVAQAREALKLATADYSDAIKTARLNIKYAAFILDARGKS